MAKNRIKKDNTNKKGNIAYKVIAFLLIGCLCVSFLLPLVGIFTL